MVSQCGIPNVDGAEHCMDATRQPSPTQLPIEGFARYRPRKVFHQRANLQAQVRAKKHFYPASLCPKTANSTHHQNNPIIARHLSSYEESPQMMPCAIHWYCSVKRFGMNCVSKRPIANHPLKMCPKYYSRPFRCLEFQPDRLIGN